MGRHWQPPACPGSLWQASLESPGCWVTQGTVPQHSPDGFLHHDGSAALAAHTELAPRVKGGHVAAQPGQAFQHSQGLLPLRLLQEPQQDVLAPGAAKEKRASGDIALPTEPSL